MDEIAIRIEHVSKEYRLGAIGGGTLRGDLQSLMARIKGREDPNSKIGSDSSKRMGERFLALDDVSFEVKKGEALGIIGHNGAGKSTLLKLLLRFWERSGGQIRYNGTDIDEINTESLYRNVTMVSQSTYLFDATIAENLRIAKPDATDEELMAALRMASAEELVQALPEGLSTPAGLLGGRLSMGERQRIGLARAFLSGCPLILLDEPTSNVDSINEGVILRALLKHRRGRTIILVSHRASTMAVADRVYKMENGQMEEQAI